MPHRKIVVKHLAHVGCELWVYLGQPLGHVGVNGGFSEPEFLCRVAHGASVFDYVRTEKFGAILFVVIHITPFELNPAH